MACCNNVQNLGCNNNANNTAVIIAAIIALILINVLDDDTNQCLATVLISIGDLITTGTTKGCLNNLVCGCNYY